MNIVCVCGGGLQGVRWRGREEVQKKVERQDLSWQPYCQHTIVQSNPHLNRKQCTRRKTGKTNKSKASGRKKYIKTVHFDLTDYRNNNKGTTQSLNWRDTNEKGRYKLYAEVLCGSEARAKVNHVLNI